MTTDQLTILHKMYDAGFAKKYMAAYFHVSQKKLNMILKEYDNTNNQRT